MRSVVMFCWLALVSLSTPLMAQELQTVGQLDLERYQGTWYEIARKPLFFQRKCVQSQALYKLTPEGTVALTNSCMTKQGKTDSVTGTASLQEPGRTDRLWVVFDNWFSNLFPKVTRGQYWVIHIDEQYKNVLVGEPERKYLWLMSREPSMDKATQDMLLEAARAQGYSLDDLIWRKDE